MKRTPQKNFLSTGWRSAVALIAVLLVVSLIPPTSVGDVRLRRANILSDLWQVDPSDEVTHTDEPLLFDEEEFDIDINSVQSIIEADSTELHTTTTTYLWEVEGAAMADNAPKAETVGVGALLSKRLIPIEPADSSTSPLISFCDSLLSARRVVRIAVLGDSFIEGDILTADLREQLQRRYGGGGTGFAPMASPLTAFRRSVKTQSKGWTTYNIMQRKTTPEPLRSSFYVSGWVCSPEVGAQTRWEMTDFRNHLKECTTAHLIFISPRESRVEVVLNDTLRREFTIEGDAAVRQIEVRAPRIHTLTMRVVSGNQGFVGYGAQFEGKGIAVDNYSVRSNNGQAMFWTNPSINSQINSLLGYDMVILQYGLNIMQSGVKNYTSYGKQIEKMVAYTRECFPGAEVLVMGVSDRSVKGDNGFEQMDAIPYMTACQRNAAHRAGASFWSTSEAMHSMGGMAEFVKNGWAGKDYTHINYAGGRRIAYSLADAINSAVELRRAQHIRREEQIVDSLHRSQINRRILAPATAQPLKHKKL